MNSFTDSSGRSWSITINYKTCKMVHEATRVNLLDLRNIDETLGRLRFDHLLIADIVIALCSQECRARDLHIDVLAAALDGEVLSKASDAILEGLGNFFRRSHTGKLLSSLIEKMRTLEAAAIHQAISEIETTSGPSGDSATASPESSA
jgi:hypothetical protein